MAVLVTALVLAAIQFFALANSEQPPHFELPVIYNARMLENGCRNDQQVRTVLEEELRKVVKNMILPRIPVGLQPSRPANSCSEIAEQNLRQASGIYWIQSCNNHPAVQVYCDMDRVCGCNNTQRVDTCCLPQYDRLKPAVPRSMETDYNTTKDMWTSHSKFSM